MAEPFRRRPQPREPSPAALEAFLTGAETPPPAPNVLYPADQNRTAVNCTPA